MSLCFLQAFAHWKGGKMTEQDLLNHTLAHFQGVRHKDDEISSNEVPLANFEPWLAAVRVLALAGDYEPLESTYENSPW